MLVQEGGGEALAEANYAQYYGKFRTKAPAIKVRLSVVDTHISV